MNFHRLRFGQGIVSVMNAKLTQVVVVHDTVAPHAFRDPLNGVLLDLGFLPQEARQVGASLALPEGRWDNGN